LLKKSCQFDNLSSKVNTHLAVFAQKASELRNVIKTRFIAQLAAKRTCENMSGTFCVLNIIQKSKKGVDPRELKQMTGFNKQKVHKILYKLFKQGAIRIEGGGMYAGVKKERVERDVQSLH